MKVTKAKGLNAKPFILTVVIGASARRAVDESQTAPPMHDL
jgi:hypothetical protein